MKRAMAGILTSTKFRFENEIAIFNFSTNLKPREKLTKIATVITLFVNFLQIRIFARNFDSVLIFSLI